MPRFEDWHVTRFSHVPHSLSGPEDVNLFQNIQRTMISTLHWHVYVNEVISFIYSAKIKTNKQVARMPGYS